MAIEELENKVKALETIVADSMTAIEELEVVIETLSNEIKAVRVDSHYSSKVLKGRDDENQSGNDALDDADILDTIDKCLNEEK